MELLVEEIFLISREYLSELVCEELVELRTLLELANEFVYTLHRI